MLISQCTLVAMWWWQHVVQKARDVPMLGWDFVVYWSASSLALRRGAAAAYNWQWLHAVEKTVYLPLFEPFAYPPTFLFTIYPIALLPLGVAIAAWSVLGVACYLLFVRAAVVPNDRRWLLPALAFPGMWLSLVAGQNALFTLALSGTALLLLDRRPVVAGACIALLCIKPQLGVLFPLFLLCRRHWITLASAAVFSLLYCGLVWLALGTDTYLAFAHALTTFHHVVAEHSVGTIRGAPTVFAICRVAGVSVGVSYLAHAAVAGATVAACIWLWRTNARFGLSAAALGVATILVQPYLIYYDLAWLALPIAFLTVDYAKHGADTVEKVVLIAAWLIPAQAFAAVLIGTLPQCAPVVLVALLAVIGRRHLKLARALQSTQRSPQPC
ncbi:glycosyltransferase family 87 protein [Burkholderia sp. MR1-5-21]